MVARPHAGGKRRDWSPHGCFCIMRAQPAAGEDMNDTVDTAEANRLYWESDESVADIAARLDMSRRALYDAIEPLPSGGTCDVCGGPLTFENRSARTAGHASCEVCAATGATPEEHAAAAAAAEDGHPAFDERTAWLGGAALAGAALGALVTFALVSRR
jgi:hypothetical protein